MHRFRVALRRRAAAAPLVAALLAALAACGSTNPPSPKATTTATAGDRMVFTASTFSVTVPSGWTDRTNDTDAVSAIQASGVMQMLLIAPASGATVNGEHIDCTTVAQPVPDDQLAGFLQSVAQNGATSVSTPQPFNLNGATGLYVTYNLTAVASPPAQAPMLKVQDMVINHGGQTYEIVLNAAQADFDRLNAALQQVLSSWRWH